MMRGVTRIYTPVIPHECWLPPLKGVVTSTPPPVGTVIQCRDCGLQWIRADMFFQRYGTHPLWRRSFKPPLAPPHVI